MKKNLDAQDPTRNGEPAERGQLVDFATERLRRLGTVQPDERSEAVRGLLRAVAKLELSTRRKDRALARLIRAAATPARRLPLGEIDRAAERLEIVASGADQSFRGAHGARWAVLACRAAFLAGRCGADPKEQESIFRSVLTNHEIGHAMFSSEHALALCDAMTRQRVCWRVVLPIFAGHELRSEGETLRKLWEAELAEMRSFAKAHANLREKRK